MITALIIIILALVLVLVGGVALVASLLPYILIIVGLKIIYNIVKLVVEKDNTN